MDFWERMGMAEWRNGMIIVVLRPRRLYMIVYCENTICSVINFFREYNFILGGPNAEAEKTSRSSWEDFLLVTKVFP